MHNYLILTESMSTSVFANTTEAFTGRKCEATNLTIYVIFFIASQLLMGLGGTPILSIAIAFLDENVSQRTSPLFLSITSIIFI